MQSSRAIAASGEPRAVSGMLKSHASLEHQRCGRPRGVVSSPQDGAVVPFLLLDE